MLLENTDQIGRYLSDAEIEAVGGGAVDWGQFWAGTATLTATVAAIALAPETAGLSLLALGAVAGGASAGISYGLAFSG